MALTSRVLPELLIFDQIPNELKNTKSYSSAQVITIVEDLLNSVTKSKFNVSNKLLETIDSFDINSLLFFWKNDKAFDVLKNSNNPRFFEKNSKIFWKQFLRI